MKKNNFISLVLLISLVALLFSTCKKYPEDEFISLRTVKQRLEAEWQIQKIEINGNDVTYMYNDSLSQSIDSYRLWFDLNVQIQPNNKATANHVYFNKSSKSKKSARDADVCVLEIGWDQRRIKKLWISDNSRTMFPVKDSIEFKKFTMCLGNFQKWEIQNLYKSEMIWTLNTGIVTKKIIFKKIRSK